MPSYKIQIQIEYTTKMIADGEELKSVIFEKEILYETNRLMSLIYKIPEDELEISPNMVNMFFENDKENNREKYYYVSSSLRPEDNITIAVNWEAEALESSPGKSETSNQIFLIVIIIILCVVFYLILVIRNRRWKQKYIEEEGTGTSDQFEDERIDNYTISVLEKKAKYNQALSDLEGSKKQGKVSSEVYIELKRKYRKKLSEIDNGMASGGEKKAQEIQELSLKKRKMLNAIKKIDEDFEAGELPREIYQELRGEYRIKTIEILKSIERLEK
jgi:hypothetical protein